MRDVGERPSSEHTIDRIDSNGHYEPNNVRWATRDIQNANKRSNHYITANGETLMALTWARRLGTHPTAINNRIKRGWTPERAVTTPIRHYGSIHRD